MVKFHIGKNGKPTLCTAAPGNCPFGGEEQHYPNKEEAQKHIEHQLLTKYEIYNPNNNKKVIIRDSPDIENTNGTTIANSGINLSTADIHHIHSMLNSLRESGISLKDKEIKTNEEVREKLTEIINLIGTKKVGIAFFNNIEKEYGHYVHREISMAYNIATKNTYSQKVLSGRKINIIDYTQDNNGKPLSISEQVSYFKAGMLHTNKEQKNINKKLSTDTDYQNLIQELKEDSFFCVPDTTDEKENAYDKIDEIPMSTQDLLSDYTQHDFSEYTYLSHGYDKERGKLNKSNLNSINNRIYLTKTSPGGKKRMMFRGMGTPVNMNSKEYLDTFHEGEVIVTNKMTSTSLDIMVAKSFCRSKEDKGVIVVYYSNVGMYVEPITRYKNEEEVIVPISQQFVVTEKIISNNGNNYIIVTDYDENE